MNKQWRLISLVVLMLALSLVIATYQMAQARPEWKIANDVSPQALIDRAIQDNFLPYPGQPALTGEQVKVMKLQPQGQTVPLYIFDFNTPDLCGIAGCLFAGYVPEAGSYKRVLNLLLQPQLPEKVPIVAAVKQNAQGLTCLNIAQAATKQKISHLTWCYDGQQYRLVNQVFVSVGDVNSGQSSDRVSPSPSK